jgi:hypothetical protein
MRDGVMTDLDFLRPGEENRSPYYQEMLAPLGLRYFIEVKVAAGDDAWCLAIQRSPRIYRVLQRLRRRFDFRAWKERFRRSRQLVRQWP